MLDNKYFVNLYVLSLDKNFEIFIPVDEKVGNIIKLIRGSVDILFAESGNVVLLNCLNGKMYNNNDIIRNTDIDNGTKLMLI